MRADFDRTKNEWFIESPIALSERQKVVVVKFLRDSYDRRIKGEIGERKKRMQEAVSKLSPQSLVVRLIGNDKLIYIDPNDKL